MNSLLNTSDDSFFTSEDDRNISDKIKITARVDCNDRALLIKEIEFMQKKKDYLQKKMRDIYWNPYMRFEDLKETKLDDYMDEKEIDKQTGYHRPLELMFYAVFTKIRINTDDLQMTIFLTVPGKKTCGLQFQQDPSEKLYSLVRFCLPYSFKADEEIAKAKSLTEKQLVNYVRYVRKNIYAYHMRSEQVETFKKLTKKDIIQVNHDLTYTCVEMIIPMITEEDKFFRMTARFYYDILDVRPREIVMDTEHCGLREEEQMIAQKYLKPYKDISLVEMYSELFAKPPPYKLQLNDKPTKYFI